jgi:glutaredoxin
VARRSPHVAFAAAVLAGLAGAGAAAQSQQVYRYVDPAGSVVYSDHLPPSDARDVEAKRLTPNLIETDQTTIAAQRAQNRFPVTLYTFACGDVCDRAEALLNRRGVPFTTVNAQEPQGAEKLKKLTGEMQVPVLQAGDKLVARGFSESQWQALLDDAGYPKAPPTRRPLPPLAVPKDQASQPVPPPAAEPPSGGYPKI